MYNQPSVTIASPPPLSDCTFVLCTGADPLSIDARCLSLRALITASAVSKKTEISCELNGLINPQVSIRIETPLTNKWRS